VSRRFDVLFGGAAALLSLVAGLTVIRVWEADLRVPFVYSGDGVLNLTVIKTVIEHGWYLQNPDLGAPNGQELYDYPVATGETLNLVLFWLGGLFTNDAALVMNLFFLLTFPLAAVAAYVVLRLLPVSPPVALVGAVLYALLPYHFLRGELHLFLSAYYAVPLGAYLVIAVLRGDGLFGRWRRTALTAGICLVVAAASGSFYYSAFTVVLAATAALLVLVARRERAALVSGAGVVGLILAFSLIQLAPTIVYRVAHGTNDEVAKRYWFESENYSLRLTNLVLPIEHHRIGGIARRRDEYVQQVPQSEGRMASLGLVGAIGFLWLLGVVLAAALGAGRRYSLGLHAGLGAVTLVAFLFATSGGLSTLAGVIWPQIRAWNRLSVFIAFFSFAAVTLLLESLRRRIGVPAFAAVLGAVLVVGVLDQTTSAYVPPYDNTQELYAGDGRFVQSLAGRLPPGASVVELPYEPFPEPSMPPPQDPYEPAKPYAHSSGLRWSWGAMRGRPSDWAATIAGKAAPDVVAASREAGFSALLIDRSRYQAPPGGAETDFQALLGDPLLVGAGDRWVAYRL
jgi:hypothetical protein